MIQLRQRFNRKLSISYFRVTVTTDSPTDMTTEVPSNPHIVNLRRCVYVTRMVHGQQVNKKVCHKLKCDVTGAYETSSNNGRRYCQKLSCSKSKKHKKIAKRRCRKSGPYEGM